MPSAGGLVVLVAMVGLPWAAASASLAATGAADASGSPPTNTGRPDRLEVPALPSPIATRLAWARSHLAASGLGKLEQIGRQLAPGIASGAGFAALRSRGERDVARSFTRLTGIDVSQATFIVLAIAAQDMDDEMHTILPEVDRAANAKEKLRAMVAELNAWIAREMGEHSTSVDLDAQTPVSSGTSGRGPTPTVLAQPAGIVTLEMRTSQLAGIRYLRVSAVSPLPPRTPAPALGELRALRDQHYATLAKISDIESKVDAQLQLVMDRRSKFVQTLSELMAKVSTTQDGIVQNLK